MIVIKKINIGVILLLAFLLSLTDAKLELLRKLNRISRQVNSGQSNNFDNLGNNPQRRPWSPNQANNNNQRPDLVQGTFIGFGPGDTNNFGPNQSNRPNGITVGNNNNQGQDLVQGSFVGFGPGDTNQNRQITVGAPTTPQPSRFATTQSPQYYQCLRLCPQTSEYNPICGSDDQNYHNLSRLNCSQRCGINVSMVKTGPCNPL